MTVLPKDLGSLSAEAKRDLVAKLLREKVEAAVQPLSEGQKALWFLHQMAPQSAAYNVAFTALVRSALDVSALRRALRAVTERHEMPRATFTTRGGQPLQRFGPVVEPPIDEIDARAWSADELNQRLVESCRRPFDLATGPVFRTEVFYRGAAEAVILLTVHHIAYDGLSIGVLVSDWMTFYASEAVGVPVELEPLPARFADFVRWQRDLIASPEGEAMWTYWKERLAGPLPVLQLPTDRPRPAEPSFRGGTYSFRVDEATTARLRDLTKEQGVTLYVALLAVFGALLQRYTGQDDILIGSPTAGRSRGEFERLIGYFVNPVVLRLDLSNDPTFVDYLALVRERVVEALRHADYPFPLLVQNLNPERDLSRSPLFQVDFNLMRVGQFGLSGETGSKGALSRLTLGGLDLETFTIPQQEGQFDLTFELVDTGRDLAANLKYASDLFDDSTIARMGGHIQQLIRSILDKPSQRLSALQLLTEGEARQLVEGWNGAQTCAPGPPLHERFEAQAARTPDAIAAVCDGKALTYDALNRRANQLARRLRALGAQPNTLVGLRCERTLEMVIGILGILKSGAAYLPMDPAYPRDRLGFMLQDSATRTVVAERSLAPDLEGLTENVVVVEDSATGDEGNLPTKAGANHLAYVIYTSGSTGKPKGVEITHHNVGRLMDATHPWYGFDATDVWTLFHSYAFDFSVWEIWGALLYGGRLVVVPYWVSRSPDAFRALLVSEKVTVLNQTPAAFRQLLQADMAQPPAEFSLRYVVFGGEALELQSLRPWFGRYGDDKPLLVNMYGITETTVHVTYRPIRLADVEGVAGSVIGQPIPDLQVHLLDRYGALVPIGVAGEMYVGGAGVGLGYLNRPELTAARFIDDQFAGAGRKLYRSGDLARRLANGDLEYLGRIDHQVKIRGFRIELGEIEAAIAAHPDVREVIVLAREDAGDKRLVAYVVAHADHLAETLRQHLRVSLPEYMMPAHFVVLDAFPLTANGKVDRSRLPAPEMAVAATKTFVAPRNATEEILSGLWAEVLGVDRVSADADFFDLGGHSLTATQVVTRARKVFGIDLPFRDLFTASTVGGLAARIDALRSSGERAVSRPVPRPADHEGRLSPLSFAQQRLWFLDQLGSEAAEYAIVGAIEMRGTLDVLALEKAVGWLVERHESLRTTFTAVDGVPSQLVQPATRWRLQVEQVHDISQADLEQRMRAISTLRFDLEKGPLFRCVLYRTATDRHVLLLAMHHIVSDGWSIGVLVSDLSTLYADAIAGREPSLAPTSLQYRDYARWQREHFDDAAFRDVLDRWKERLHGAPREIDLPSDRPRPPAESHRGAMHAFVLPRDVADGLRALSRRQGTTLFMTLLALFDTLLWKYTGQDDLVVGTPVANRGRPEFEGLVGVFVNTIMLRTRIDADASFADLLSRVRETALDSLGDEELPFERLVEALRPERDLSRNPLFQVMLVLQNMPLKPLDLPELALRPVDIDRGAAQLDLTFYLQESEDGLKGFLEYATDLFDAGRIERMAGHFEQLARSVLADPKTRLSALGMLTAEELETVRSWNATDEPWLQACAHDVIAAQARKTPGRPALLFGDTVLTFADLEEKASAVAERLAALGVRPGSLVGVLIERGPDMVAGVLGVLKAGAAYVPMDPAFPADRLAYMLEDSGASVLLTQEALTSMFETSAKVLLIDRFKAEDPRATAAPASLDDLAYVIYTSGSTGRPKGVAITHRSLSNLLYSMQKEPGLTEADTFLSVTTLSFDIAGLELYLPLMMGGRLVVASRDDVSDGRALMDRLESSGATVMQATPATWRLMLESGWSGNSFLKVLCGGEALPRDLADTLCGRVGELWNVYGPTETTIWSACERVRAEPGPVSIGRPIANTTMYVLDRTGAVLPVGMAGELHIGGAGLARGYWRRDELTAERFIDDRVSGKPGRLYKTGDQARWLSDGRLECLGRLDHQVKIRGYRIELEEIEVALRAHPGVDQAVVVVQQSTGGDPRLVAYLAEATGVQPNVTELRTHLRKTLPTYMVPSTFVTLDRLPLTPNGKVDRKALIALETGVSARAVAVAPRTPMEQYIAGVWREALNVAAVGPHDNFFDLGGHSLLAMRVLAAIEKRTGRRLHPRDIIFQNLEQLARACGELTPVMPAEPAEEARAGRFRNALRSLIPGRSKS